MVTLSAPANLLTNIETSNGGERISTTLQSDYTFTLGMRGYSWDKANGGSSPDNQSIANGDFWDSTATSHKHTAGTLIIGSAADLVPLTEEAAAKKAKKGRNCCRLRGGGGSSQVARSVTERIADRFSQCGH